MRGLVATSTPHWVAVCSAGTESRRSSGPMMRKRTERKVEQTKLIAEGVSRRALPFSDPADLDPLIERIGDATYVLLGEATHGTSEFYEWRAALSRRLIEERGFSFVGVEGDWPDCYRVNRYVKSYADS